MQAGPNPTITPNPLRLKHSQSFPTIRSSYESMVEQDDDFNSRRHVNSMVNDNCLKGFKRFIWVRVYKASHENADKEMEKGTEMKGQEEMEQKEEVLTGKDEEAIAIAVVDLSGSSFGGQ